MVDIAAENKYISYMMGKISTDNVEKESYTVKKGDNLWNLAKKELGSGATNQEISQYMLLIAKMNGLDTYEKMNNIKYGQSIFMPDTGTISAREYISSQKDKKEITAAEKSMYEILKQIENNELNIEKCYSGTTGVEVYLATKYDDELGYPITRASIKTSGSGENRKIREFSFEDSEKNLQPERLDYALYPDGNLTKGSYSEYTAKQNGHITTLPAVEVQKVNNSLKNLLNVKAESGNSGKEISIYM